MAFELIKVSELPELTTPSDSNVIPIQDGDYLKRISFENLKEAVTGDVADDLAAEVTARESAVSGEATARGNADAAILADLASPYSASSTYAVGDYCTKDGVLKRCNTAITTAEAWNSAHWDDAKLGGDVSTLRSALTFVDVGTIDVTKTITQRLTVTQFTEVMLKAGHQYAIKFKLANAVNHTTYCYLKDLDAETNLISTSIASGNTEYSSTYTVSGNDDIRAALLSQTSQDGATTITVTLVDNNSAEKQLSDFKSDLDELDYSKVSVNTNNLYRGTGTILESTMLNNSGVPQTSATYAAYTTTDYVKVKPETTYSNSIEGGNFRVICFFDKDKVNLGESTTLSQKSTFTTPEDAEYIRLSIYTTNYKYCALFESSTTQQYEEYNPIINYLDPPEFEYRYGDSLFTSTWNALGTVTDTAHATCYKRKRGNDVVGVVFACRAYASHTYFAAFDSNGDVISTYSLTGNTTTGTKHIVKFGNDVAYYSVQTLEANKETSYLSEIITNFYEEINAVKSEGDSFDEKTYRAIKDNKMDRWTELRFGLFIHWGVYSAWAGEYTGLNIDGEQIVVTNGTEWMWQANKIPKDAYMAKQTDFTGANWNPDYICQMAKMLGMEYIVITSRHHEGFSLMESNNCEWDITDSGCDRDVLMELKEACNRYHLKFSLYVSPLMDWCDEGGFGQEAWHNGSDPYTYAQHQVFVTKQLAYLNELVEKYEPFSIWYDGGTYVTVRNEFKDQFNKNQMSSYPYAIVNNRGEGIYDYKLAENTYADYPNTDEKYERCNSLCGWGYNHRQDTLSNYLTPQGFIWDLAENVGRGFNYLLNISPKGDGSIPDPTFTRFTQIADFFHKYTYFNKAKRLFNYCQPSWGRPLGIGNSVYLLLLPNGSSTITVDSIVTSEIKGVHVYGIQNPDASANYEILGADCLQITNIPTTSDDYFPVVRIDFYNEPICLDYNIVDTAIGGVSFVRTAYNEWAETTTGVRLDGYYRFGSDNSTSISRFKFDGTTGTYSFSPDGTVSGTVNFAYTLYDSNMELISTGSSFSLTNGEIYSVEIKKTGSGTYNMVKLDIE